jgi:uncharacterized protein (TIGR03437 family)
MLFTQRRWAALAFLSILSVPVQAQLTMNQPTRMVAVAAGPNPRIFAAVENGFFRSSDDGLNWTAIHLRPAGQRQPLITFLLTDPVNPMRIYAGTENDDGAVWRSTDGGITWATANRGLPSATGIVESISLVPATPQTLYLKTGAEVYKTIDGGDNWTLQSTLSDANSAFAIAPSNPSIMFYTVRSLTFRSRDEGRTWSPQAAVPLVAGAVVAIVVDPRNPSIVYFAGRDAGAGAGIYKSNDEGANVNLIFRLNAFYIAHDPARGFLYASSLEDNCVYYSVDEGRTWPRFACLGAGSGGVRVAFVPASPDSLWAATSLGPFRAEDRNLIWQVRSGSVRPTLAAPPAQFNFLLSPGAQGRLDLPLRIVETDRWSAPVTLTTSGEPWLSLANVPNSTPGAVQVRVNTQGLSEGTHAGTVRVASSQVNNSPLEVPVRVTVRAAATGPSYTISTLTGIGQNATFGDGGQAALAAIGPPDSLATDSEGSLYISDPANNRVRRILSSGVIERYAGTGQANASGDGADARLAGINSPRGLAIDQNRRLIIADTGNNRIRAVTADRSISTFRADVPGTRGVAVDNNGNVYVALPSLHTVVRIAPDGSLRRFAGTTVAGFRTDGVAADQTRLSAPNDVAVDASGNVYIADTENHRIRKVTPDGIIQTVAGNGLAGFQGDGDEASLLSLARPNGIGLDAAGNLYIADTDNQRIRVLTPQGQLRTIGGSGTGGFAGDGGPALGAQFQTPVDVAVDPAGNVYVADNSNVRVRKLAPPAPSRLPEISPGGVVNAADGSPRLSPGVLFSLFGRNLTTGNQTAGVAVTMNGVSVPLLFISEGQINGQVPFEIQPGDVTVRASLNGARSQEAVARITAAAPAIFQFGSNRAVAQNPDFTVNTAENPAAPGAAIVVYLTGQGLLDNPLATGAPAPASPLSRPLLPVSATIGGREATVLFLGMSPGFIGLAQANLIVPDLPPGDYPVVITIGGSVSSAAQITIGTP